MFLMKLLFFGLPGGAEWILIFLAILLLFGGRKIPELMKGIGKGIREFNTARSNIKSEIEEGIKEPEKGGDKEKEKDTSPPEENKSEN